MNYKIVARDNRTRRQVKKRIYTTLESYEKYSPELIKRYLHLGYEVEVYVQVSGKWCISFIED